MSDDLEAMFDLPAQPNLREQREADDRWEDMWAKLMAPRMLGVAAWPLCLPEEGAGPWLAMVGLAVAAWLAGTAYTHIRQPRPRRPVRPVPRREGVR